MNKKRSYSAERYWTKEEVNCLLGQVKKSPNNLRHAFRETSRLLDGKRSPLSCQLKWQKMPEEQKGICFLTVGQSGTQKNTKNKAPEKNKRGFWKKILSLFK